MSDESWLFRVVSDIGRDNEDRPLLLRARLIPIDSPESVIGLAVFHIPCDPPPTEEVLQNLVSIFDTFINDMLNLVIVAEGRIH